MTLKRGLYKGFSSYEYEQRRTFKLTDVELVKLDLLNHLWTRRGERVRMPLFGTRIPDLPFEPLDDITLDILEQDIKQVINFDPRVKLLNLSIIPNYDMNSVVASVQLLYLELNMSGSLDLNIQFESS